MAHVGGCASGFGEQYFHVLAHAVGLPAYIARMHDHSFVVDTCRSRDKHTCPVGEIYGHSAFEGHSVFARTVKVRCSVKEAYCAGWQVGNRITVHCDGR